jgi:hypothetical protein
MAELPGICVDAIARWQARFADMQHWSILELEAGQIDSQKNGN